MKIKTTTDFLPKLTYTTDALPPRVGLAEGFTLNEMQVSEVARLELAAASRNVGEIDWSAHPDYDPKIKADHEARGVVLCACMGPVKDDQFCPCGMKSRGLRGKYIPTAAETAEFNRALDKALSKMRKSKTSKKNARKN